MWLVRGFALFVFAVAANVALAGEGYEKNVVAATPDGAYQAFGELAGSNVRCGLEASGPRPHPPELSIAAVCVEKDRQALLPIEQWKWARTTPEIKRLRPFDDKTPWETARVFEDPDTRVERLEIRRNGKWITVRVIEPDPVSHDGAPWISGVMVTPAGFLLRAKISMNSIVESDEVWTVSHRELDEAPQRRERARAEAREGSLRMRAHRTEGTGVFAPKPPGTSTEAWERRRRHGIATFIHRWEIAAAYGSLTAAELQDALWLLGWFDSQPRRYQALRWYGGLLERDSRGAASVLAVLLGDADTRALAEFLHSTKDPLRNLPGVASPVTDEALRALGDDQLHWLHRWYRALQRYRFSDPAAAKYFALRPDYNPYSEKRWRRMLKESHGNPDVTFVSGPRPITEFQRVFQEEQRRGIGAPPF